MKKWLTDTGTNSQAAINLTINLATCIHTTCIHILVSPAKDGGYIKRKIENCVKEMVCVNCIKRLSATFRALLTPS